MTSDQIFDLNIIGEKLLPTPEQVKTNVPLSEKARGTVVKTRSILRDILDGKDKRIFVVVGPCSIHDIPAAEEYALKLRELASKVESKMVLLMRTYFEKPRTSVGWKGFINDPDLDDSFKIDEGLHRARLFLLKLNELGIPAATEALDPITPQYLDDLISWTAIGARTTESQTHREMASGLSTPVGFKNGTDGNIQVAINAMLSARERHHFLGINKNGQCAVMQTRGNRYGHAVLRGGAKPNYDSESVANCAAELKKAGLPQNIMIDCSHGNSLKDYKRQPGVYEECLNQICAGKTPIVGFMIESNLEEGNQRLDGDKSKLKRGVSITDACIGWEKTEELILNTPNRLA